MKEFIQNVFSFNQTGQTIVILSLVIALGTLLGKINIKKISLGVAGVLFAGIFFSHYKLGLTLDIHVLEFLRDFGLVLFVYTIGMQIGPGFFSSLRSKGLVLNGLAATIVILGTLIAAAAVLYGGFTVAGGAGAYSGAVTNTPALAAGQAALTQIGHKEVTGIVGAAYAVCYPFGVVGLILAMLITKAIFKIDLVKEAKASEEQAKSSPSAPDFIDLDIANPEIVGIRPDDIPGLKKSGLVVSRVYRDGEFLTPTGKATLQLGDTIRIVGPHAKLDSFVELLGRKSGISLHNIEGQLSAERIHVTKHHLVNKTIGELDFKARLGVVVTRIIRGDIELVASDNMHLHLGDLLYVVGNKAGLEKARAEIGNVPAALDHPQLISVFVGMILGVILGNIPIPLPGVQTPVRLGMAGGPLIVAILMSQFGRIGPMINYLKPGANLAIREFGITIFLGCVGLLSGAAFIKAITSSQGLSWFVAGMAITFIPVMITAIIARLVFKVDFPTICGLIGGSHTDPPALAFGASFTGSKETMNAYATIYPLSMALRIFAAQLLVLVLSGIVRF